MKQMLSEWYSPILSMAQGCPMFESETKGLVSSDSLTSGYTMEYSERGQNDNTTFKNVSDLLLRYVETEDRKMDLWPNKTIPSIIQLNLPGDIKNSNAWIRGYAP